MFWVVVSWLRFLCLVVVFAGLVVVWTGHELPAPFGTLWFLSAIFVAPGVLVATVMEAIQHWRKRSASWRRDRR
jgi:hypothetical protein